MALPTALTARVAFSTNPLATPTWTDISTYVRGIGSIRRGRQFELERWETGELVDLILANGDRRFEPGFAASPYYPNVQPSKRLNIRVTHNAITYDIFTGLITRWPRSYPGIKDAVVSLGASDIFRLFSKYPLEHPYVMEVLKDSPQSYWRLNESDNDSPAADSSGHGHYARFEGAVTMSQTGPIAGDAHRAISLASGQYVSLPAEGVISGNGNWSVELWVNFAATNSPNTIELVRMGGGPVGTASLDNLSIYVDSAGSVKAQYGATQVSPPAGPALGAWGHVVFTYDGTNLRGYLNAVVGTPVAKAPVSIPFTEGAIGGQGAVKVAGVTIYDGVVLSASRITAHYDARNAWAGDATGVRLGRLLDLIGVASADRDLDTGQSLFQEASDYDGSNALTEMQDLVTAEDGALFIEGDGIVVFHDRHARLKSPFNASVATFGDGGGSEVKYRDILPSFDIDLVRNQIEITRAGGTTQIVNDVTSIGKHGTQDLRETYDITTDNEALDAANWKLRKYKDPVERFEQITIKPGNNDARWVQVLSRKIGDRITVKMRPPGGGAVFSQDCHIEAIEHRPGRQWGEWETDFMLSPAEVWSYWILGDATYSVLGSTTRVAYGLTPLPLLLSGLAHPFSVTGPAMTLRAAVFPCVVVGVGFVVRMALRAMRFRREQRTLRSVFRPSDLVIEGPARFTDAVALRCNVGVFRREGVSTQARRSSSVLRAHTRPAKDVLAFGRRPKVPRIDTPFVVAEVVNNKAVWNGAYPQLVGDTMCIQRTLSVPGLRISGLEMRAVPFPAAVRLHNSLKKALQILTRKHRSIVSTPPDIILESR